MDLSNITGSEPLRIGEYRLQRLTLGDLAGLLDQLRDERRAAFVKNLDAAGVDGSFDRLTELQKFDDTPLGLADGFRWCRTPGGVAATLAAAIIKTGLELDPDTLIAKSGIDPTDAVYYAAELWGFPMRMDPATEAEPEGEPEADDPLLTTTTGG